MAHIGFGPQENIERTPLQKILENSKKIPHVKSNIFSENQFTPNGLNSPTIASCDFGKGLLQW